MSQDAIFTHQIYAIDNSNPPQIWTSELRWDGYDEPPAILVPEGFHEVTVAEYQEAARRQQVHVDRAFDQAEYQTRVTLSQQRQALADTGMTVQQAQILVPDPQGDFSIDTWA